MLVKKHGDDVYEKSIVVCSGVDMVNIQFQNIIFKDKETAEVCFIETIIIALAKSKIDRHGNWESES